MDFAVALKHNNSSSTQTSVAAAQWTCPQQRGHILRKWDIFLPSKRSGVWPLLVNTDWEQVTWATTLPYIHQWEQSGNSANACHCFLMQNKIPDSSVFLTESLIEWTIRAGMLAAPASPQICSKLHSRDIQSKSNQTWPNFSWMHSVLSFFQVVTLQELKLDPEQWSSA